MKVSLKTLLVLFFSMTLLSAPAWAYEEIPIEPTPEGEGGSENNDNQSKSLRDAAKAARDRAVAISVASGAAAAYFGYHCIQGNIGACAVSAIALSTSFSTANYANQQTLSLNINEPEEQAPPDGGGNSAYCESVHSCGGGNDGTSPSPEDHNRRNQKTQEMLGGAGFRVDKNGNIQTPKGTFSPNQMNSSTMASLGVTPELQAEFRAKMQEEIARAAAQRENSAVAEGGGGSPVRVLRAQSDSEGWNQPPSAPQRGIASVDGLSVRRGDDLIGIQSADIFDMVHKKYQQLRQQNTFKE